MVKGEGLRGHFYIFRSKQKLKCNISKSVQDYVSAMVGRNQPANAGGHEFNPRFRKTPHSAEQLKPICHSY